MSHFLTGKSEAVEETQHTCRHCPDGGHAVATEEPLSADANTVVIVGNPNVGKSTLFNALTGGRQTVRNAPGTTVEVFQGNWKAVNARLLDLPGTYSLLPNSPDEAVVSDTICGVPGSLTDPERGGKISLVMVVLDATALQRSLYLLGQVAQTGRPVVAVLTMQDVAEASGEAVPVASLAQTLGIPVVAVDARNRKDAQKVVAVVKEALHTKPRVNGISPDPYAPGYNETAAEEARVQLAKRGFECVGADCFKDDSMERSNTLFSWVQDIAEKAHTNANRQVSKSFSDRVDEVLLNPILGTIIFFALMWGVFYLMGSDTVNTIKDYFENFFHGGPDDIPFSLTQGVSALFGWLGIGGGWLESIINDGLLTGLGVVASFIPLMFIMFVAIALMEDSGYMARAAFLGDRMMRLIGLDGRVILPLIVGFGCNLPALAAIRTLPNSKQRIVTTMIIPWASCSARVTIYVLMARIFFGSNAGNVVFGLYVASLVLIVLGGLVLKPFLTKNEAKAPLMLVLPPYQTPKVLVLLRSAATRSWAFVTGAGKIIVILTILIWFMMSTPVAQPTAADLQANKQEIATAQAAVKSAKAELAKLKAEKAPAEKIDEAQEKLDNAITEVPITLEESYGFGDPGMPQEYSLYGKLAGGLAPIFKPAGFDDWHISGALMTGFIAKETVISSIVASYNMSDAAVGSAEEDGTPTAFLETQISKTFTQTAGGAHPEDPVVLFAVLGFLVFVLAYTPCLATVAEQARQVGWKWALGGVVVQLGFAWILAVAFYQVGRLWFG